MEKLEFNPIAEDGQEVPGSIGLKIALAQPDEEGADPIDGQLVMFAPIWRKLGYALASKDIVELSFVDPDASDVLESFFGDFLEFGGFRLSGGEYMEIKEIYGSGQSLPVVNISVVERAGATFAFMEFDGDQWSLWCDRSQVQAVKDVFDAWVASER